MTNPNTTENTLQEVEIGQRNRHRLVWLADPITISSLLAWIAFVFHAYLLPAGHWQADDYIMTGLAKTAGLKGFVDRMFGWSPRPVAELINYGYFSLVSIFNRPLIGSFLCVLWGGAYLGLALCSWLAGIRRPLCLAILWFALVLLMAKPGEMFFWPTGADVYLPCWAAFAAASVLQRSTGRSLSVLFSISLLIAAFCSEIGAVTVLLYTGLRTVGLLIKGETRSSIIALVLPALAALAVCLIVQIHRVQVDREIMDAGSHLAGHWIPSAIAAVPSFGRELLGIQGMPLWLAALVKLCLLLSLGGLLGESRTQRLPALLWAAALLLGAFIAIVLAFHQFGNLCCERHATLRQGMIFLAIAVFSTALGHQAWNVRRWLLPIAVIILMGFRVDPLLHDLSIRHQIMVMRQESWHSGLSHEPKMQMTVGPETRLLSSDALPPGTYHRQSRSAPGDTPWYAWGIMMLFDKDDLQITMAH
ncbi:hypothetical protein [Asaia sp. HN010]|uniref:hypothetical protein n=1 Tax=Asaia sp. HN010 TaxID=3081233 RepID=UPI00301A55D7